MRRVLFIILTALVVFAGCAEQITSVSHVYTGGTSSEYSSALSIEETSSEYSSTSDSEYSSTSDSEETSTENSETPNSDDSSYESSFQIIDSNVVTYPLLFIDTTDTTNNDKAYVLCAFNEDRIYSTHEFLYNGKRLSDFVFEYDMLVESNIIDTEKDFVFYDNRGNRFETGCENLFCYGEEIINEVHVCASIKTEIKNDAKRYLGTYGNIDVFPSKIEYDKNSITVDLDANGVSDNIYWTLSPAEDEYADEGYCYYSLEATINGKKVSIADNEDWLPLAREDLEVFIADVDMDGVFEIVVYEKTVSRFNNVFIYKINEESGKLLYSYTITPEP